MCDQDLEETYHLMPSSMCLTTGCPEPATYKGRCQSHARKENASISRAGRDLYRTKRWLLTRRSVLFNEPLCRCCGAIATDVDHIVPLDDGGAPFSRSNLQPMCHADHAAKTRREQLA